MDEERVSITLEEYSKLRKRQKTSALKHGSFDTLTNNFCRRWSLGRFPEEMHRGTNTVPTDVAILDSIIEHESFYAFLFEYKQIDSELGGQMLEIYGDDPDRLVSMWSWAKASGGISHVDLHTEPSEQHSLGVRSFHRQLRTDGQALLKSHRSELAQGLESFISEMYEITIDQHIEKCLRILKLVDKDDHYGSAFLQTSKSSNQDDNHVPSILFSVPGSGKTQCVFDLFSKHWGHYMVSGRTPRALKDNETLLDARYGAASLDTQFLCQLLDTVDRLDQERQWKAWQTLTDGPRHYWKAWEDVIGRPDQKHQWKAWHTLFDTSEKEKQFEESQTLMNKPDQKQRLAALGLLLERPDQQQQLKMWKTLISNRFVTLRRILRFFERKGTKSAFNERDWLLLQTACTQKFDPFLRTFQIGLLMNDLDPSSWTTKKRNPSFNDVLLCLDEAQCEIVNNFNAAEHLSPIEGLVEIAVDGGNRRNIIVSGTALRLVDFQTILKRVFQTTTRLRALMNDDGEALDSDSSPKVEEEFLVIDSDNDFQQLLRSHVRRVVDKVGYLVHLGEATEKYSLWDAFAISSPDMTKEEFYQKLKSMLVRESSSITTTQIKSAIDSFVQKFLAEIGDGDSEKEKLLFHLHKPIRGRIRWSTLFIERLLIGYIRTKGDGENRETNTMTLVEKIAEDTSRTIKSQLKIRIETLKSKGEHLLLRDLFFTAVRADLMNKASVFPDTESAQVVTEGFALLKSSGKRSASGYTKQELAEPIVIAAVIEYLRESEAVTQPGQRMSRLDKVLEQMLFDHQITAIGDVAEYYVAWALGGLLRKQSSSLVAPARKQSLLTLMRDANLISRNGSPNSSPSNLGDISDFFLEEGSTTNIGRDFTFHAWLRNIREQQDFPTILFPPQPAGPDVVFMLRHKIHPDRRILCAFQIKAGTTSHNVFSLIRTLDPNIWFSGNFLDQHQKLMAELDKFGSNLTVVTGLVIPAVGSKVYSGDQQHLTKLLKCMEGPIRTYVTLTTDDDENKRQQILQDLVANANKTFHSKKSSGLNAKDQEFWTKAIGNLQTKNDQKSQTLGAESLIRLATPELYDMVNKNSTSPMPADFLPRADTKGRDYYFVMMEAKDVKNICGESLVRLASFMN